MTAMMVLGRDVPGSVEHDSEVFYVELSDHQVKLHTASGILGWDAGVVSADWRHAAWRFGYVHQHNFPVPVRTNVQTKAMPGRPPIPVVAAPEGGWTVPTVARTAGGQLGEPPRLYVSGEHVHGDSDCTLITGGFPDSQNVPWHVVAERACPNCLQAFAALPYSSAQRCESVAWLLSYTARAAQYLNMQPGDVGGRLGQAWALLELSMTVRGRNGLNNRFDRSLDGIADQLAGSVEGAAQHIASRTTAENSGVWWAALEAAANIQPNNSGSYNFVSSLNLDASPPESGWGPPTLVTVSNEYGERWSQHPAVRFLSLIAGSEYAHVGDNSGLLVVPHRVAEKLELGSSQQVSVVGPIVPGDPADLLQKVAAGVDRASQYTVEPVLLRLRAETKRVYGRAKRAVVEQAVFR